MATDSFYSASRAGKNTENKSFQLSWYEHFQWLEYNQETGGGRCFFCKLLKPVTAKNDEFKMGKVCNWKKFIEKASQHEKSLDHQLGYRDANRIIEHEAKQRETLPEQLVKASDIEREKKKQKRHQNYV